MGGKWTSFRSQGEETVDKILKDNPGRFKDTLFNATGQTLTFNFIGSYSRAQLRDGFIQNPDQVFQQYEDFLVFEHKVPRDIAKHLIRQYGTASLRVVEIGKIRNNLKRLHEDYPFIESEVLYSIQSEMAVKPNDIKGMFFPSDLFHSTCYAMLCRTRQVVLTSVSFSQATGILTY